MNISKQYFSRTLLMLLFFVMNACVAESGKSNMANADNTNNDIVAGELIVDAVAGAELFGVEMFADKMDTPFYSRAVTSYKNRLRMGFPLRRLPQQVRVIWRKNNDVSMRSGKIVYGGPLAGDYTIPVASRIPEALLADVRKNGGSLRIKFRLKPDGVMLGWDVESKPGYKKPQKGKNIYYSPAYRHVGGDFKEARPAHYKWVPNNKGEQFIWIDVGMQNRPADSGYMWIGPRKDKFWEKGWYLDENGKKVEVDY